MSLKAKTFHLDIRINMLINNKEDNNIKKLKDSIKWPERLTSLQE